MNIEEPLYDDISQVDSDPFSVLFDTIANKPGAPQTTKMIAKMLKEQHQAELQIDASSTHEHSLVEEMRERYESTKRENNHFREYIGHLDETIDMLAEALGACDECFGEDRRCNACGGRGKPGFFKPDQNLFNRFIMPAICRVKPQRLRNRHATTVDAIPQLTETTERSN